MQLTPRYDGPAVLHVEGAAADPSVPMLRQRRRLAGVLAGLSEDQWNLASRCEAWLVQDVVAHLVGTNQFWAHSIGAGRAGQPTRILTAFDPVTTPALMVDGLRSLTPSDVLARFVESNDALAGALEDLDEAAWSLPAEAPPGHVALHVLVLHALWDAWIHERDVLLPLGVPPVEEPDEVAGSLKYVAALGPTFLATHGSERRGSLAITATDPDMQFVVEAGPTVVVRDGAGPPGAARLTGRAVDLVEALSFRARLEHDLDTADLWLLGGLAEVFDVAI